MPTACALGAGKLSMGLKGGVDFSNTNYNNLEFPDGNPTGPAADWKHIIIHLPNFGVGFYYYTDRYFAGLSVPSILTYQSDEMDQFRVSPDYMMFKTYFSAGALIRFTDAVQGQAFSAAQIFNVGAAGDGPECKPDNC